MPISTFDMDHPISCLADSVVLSAKYNACWHLPEATYPTQRLKETADFGNDSFRSSKPQACTSVLSDDAEPSMVWILAGHSVTAGRAESH